MYPACTAGHRVPQLSAFSLRYSHVWRQAMRIELTGRILPERPDRF